MGSSKTSKQTQTVELPPELRQASMDNLRLAKEVGMMPAMNNFGPAVAALTPQQEAAIGGTNAAASAFGLPTGGAGAAALPPVVDVGGVRGYSTKGIYDYAMDQLPPYVRSLLSQFTHQPGATITGGGTAPAAVAAKRKTPSFEYRTSGNR